MERIDLHLVKMQAAEVCKIYAKWLNDCEARFRAGYEGSLVESIRAKSALETQASIYKNRIADHERKLDRDV